MYSRWYNVAVVLLWMVAMGWLVVEKVLPSLLVGEPPNYQRILAAQREQPEDAWRLLWNNRPVGWALSKTYERPQGLTEVRSLVHLDQLRLSEMVPKPFQRLVPLDALTERLEMEARSVLVFDPLGHVSRFESAVGFSERAIVKIRGWVDGAELQVQVNFLEGKPTDPIRLKVGNAMLSDSLAPQSRLPNLREGQEWTVETYSPLLALSQAGQQNVPTEILHARVEGLTPVVWSGQQVEAWVVVYRGDPGSSLDAGDVRGKMWVSKEGMILKQEVLVFGSTMTFFRQSEEVAKDLHRKHAGDLEKEQMVGPLEPAGKQPEAPE